ncbi:MAG: hypothetical protein ABIJ43_05205 [Candidatus Beckwithbacteria bacterium]|nr:hypothetical protein [Patescibacteria group bacterium]
MAFDKLLSIVLVIVLSLFYSTLGLFNFLWLAVIWLAIKKWWLLIFISGLIFDLVVGSTLGLSSFKFLVVAGLIYLIKEYWPVRSQRQLKLKI